MAPKTCAFGIMAKAPRPGFSKTRLCPPLTHVQAAELSAAFLRDMIGNVTAAAAKAPIAAYIAYAPADARELLNAYVAAGTELLLADGLPSVTLDDTPAMPPGVEGFGRSLLHAMQGMLSLGHDAAIVLNSDSPTLPTAFLTAAVQALSGPRESVVLGPADDGGYYLLGMRQAHAHLFRDIAWSTDTVADTTRQRAREIGLDIVELPIWYDVDDHHALSRLLQETSGAAPQSRLIPYSAPVTTDTLARIGLRHADFATG